LIENNMDKFALPKKNIALILIGLGILILGYVLLSGGGSDNPDVFNYEMFNFRRLVLAPVVIVAGFVFVGYAIMKRPKK